MRRGHRPGQRERGHDTDVPGAGHVDDAERHRDIELTRRVSIDARPDDRLLNELVEPEPVTDPEHLEDVLNPLPSAGEREGGLVGEDKLRASDVQVPDVDRNVLGFDEWRVRRKDVEALEQLHERLVIGERAGPATVIKIGNERWPTNREEVDVVSTDRDRLGGIYCAEPDNRWGARYGLVDDFGRDANHLVVGAVPDRRPGSPENLPGLREQNPHAVLLEQTYRLGVEVVDLVVA